MYFYSNILPSCLVLFLASVANANTIFNLKQYGAVGDGKTDNTKALEKAWADACAAAGNPQITIPGGNYLVGPVHFKGRCKGSVTIQLDGNLIADSNLNRYKPDWLKFQYIDGLTIKGAGKLDGQGRLAWPYNTCPKKWQCKLLPMTMSLSFVTDVNIEGITSVDSKFFHFNFYKSKNVNIRGITIKAPGDSPNTDGIHMGASSNITISDSHIGTGDDCVSVGSDTTDLTVTGVTCGPGHGISVGSLGKDADKGDVIRVKVKNCTIFDTTNGIRIKSWQAKRNSGSAPTIRVTDFTFDDIILKNVMNPIIIDQEYCPYAACVESEPSLVKINRVKFRNIRGTSTTAEIIKLVCSRRHPCEGVELSNINLKYVGQNPALKEKAICNNVKGFSSNVKPVTCL